MLVSPSGAAAVIASAVDDFSTTTNTDTSAWSYRFSSDLLRDGSYPLLSTFGNAGIWSPATGQWNTGGGRFGIPGIAVNNTGAPINWIGNAAGFTWPDGTIWLHPTTGGLVVVSWLSSVTGLVDVEFSFADIDPNGGTGIKWFVDLNGSTGNLASGTLPNAGTSGVLNVSGVTVNTGDRINFIVDPNGSWGFDSTAMTATISSNAVPEPATVALLSLGLAGLGFSRRNA